MPSIRTAVLRNTVANLALPATAVLTGPLLARALGVEDRGALAAILAALTLAAFLAPLGMAESITYSVGKRLAPARHVRRVIVETALLNGLLAAAVVALAAPVLLRDSPQYTGLLQVLALSLPLTVLVSCYRGLAQGTGRFELMERERWILALGRAAVIVVLFAAGALTVLTGALVSALLPLVTLLAFLPVLRRQGDDSSAPVPDTPVLDAPALEPPVTEPPVTEPPVTEPPVTEPPAPTLAQSRSRLSSYSRRTAPGTVLSLLAARLDQILLAPLAGVAALGYYAVAVSLADIPMSAVAAIRDVVWAAASARDQPALIARTARVVTLVAVPGVLLGIALTPVVLPLLFGREFAPAVPVAQVLLLAVLAGTTSKLLASALLAVGEPGLRSRLQLVATVAVVVLLLALVPPFGAMGAALALLLSRCLTLVLFNRHFSRVTGLRQRDSLVPRREDVAFLRQVVRGVLRRGG